MAANAVILLVEDNEDDAFVIRRSFEKAHVINCLRTVTTGEEAIAYLKGEGVYADRAEHPLPSLLLLDLKLPGIDGFEVLRWIRQQRGFRDLHIVVVTSSADVREVNVAFRLGANAFMIKPVDFMRFAEFSEALSGSWVWVDEALVSQVNAGHGFKEKVLA